MLEFLNALFFVQHFSFYTVITFLIILSVTLLSMLMILLCYLKCDQTSDLWQQLELASEQESDLLGIAEWVRKWLVHISAGNVFWNWFYLSSLIILVLLMWKWMVLFLRKNHLLRWFKEINFSSKLDWGSYIISIAKNASRKISWRLYSFFLLRFLCIFINLPYSFGWHTVAMSVLVLLGAAWNF